MTEAEKEALIFEQTCIDFRSLNEIMWRVPILAMTLTGGLGLAIGTFEMSDLARQFLLWFMAAANIVFIIVLFRLRKIMDGLLQRIHRYQDLQTGKGFVVVRWFSLILGVSALGCILIALNVSTIFPAKTSNELVCAHGTASIRIVDDRNPNKIIFEVTCGPAPQVPSLNRHLLQGG